MPARSSLQVPERTLRTGNVLGVQKLFPDQQQVPQETL